MVNELELSTKDRTLLSLCSTYSITLKSNQIISSHYHIYSDRSNVSITSSLFTNKYSPKIHTHTYSKDISSTIPTYTKEHSSYSSSTTTTTTQSIITKN